LQVDVLGIVLAVGAGASYALYSAASKRLLAQWSPFTAAAVALSLGAMLVLPLLFFLDNRWLLQPRGLAVGLHLGLLATALPYMLYARGLTGVRVSSAVTLTLAEPVTASLLGVLVLGERLTPQALVGIALVFAGLVMISVRRRR
jgi:DME family drug/metabolite transporter